MEENNTPKGDTSSFGSISWTMFFPVSALTPLRETSAEVQKTTGAIVDIANHSCDTWKKHFVTLHGDVDAKARAAALVLKLIFSVVAGKEIDEEHKGDMIFILPPQSVRLVIGTKGSQIKTLGDTTGCEIEVPRDPTSSGQCYLKGKIEHIVAAAKRIYEIADMDKLGGGNDSVEILKTVLIMGVSMTENGPSMTKMMQTIASMDVPKLRNYDLSQLLIMNDLSEQLIQNLIQMTKANEMCMPQMNNCAPKMPPKAPPSMGMIAASKMAGKGMVKGGSTTGMNALRNGGERPINMPVMKGPGPGGMGVNPPPPRNGSGSPTNSSGGLQGPGPNSALMGQKAMKMVQSGMGGMEGTGSSYVWNLLIPAHVASAIIGPRGNIVNRIQTQSGGHIDLSKSTEMGPDRVVSFRGNDVAKSIALDMTLHQLAAAREFNHSGMAPPIRFCVPTDKCSKLIGPAGKNVQKISRECGVKIAVATDGPVHDYRAVTVAGDVESIVAAASQIFALVCGP